MPFVSQATEDFSGGIYSGRKAPADTVYDIVNGLINDEGLIYRRGGSAYKSTSNAGGTLDMLADSYVAAGQRTIFGSSTDDSMWALGANDATPVEITTGVRPFTRVAASTGVVFIPPSSAGHNYPVLAYGGSLLSSETVGTVSVTAGSATVTGSGTSWLTTVDAGMIFQGGTGTPNVVRTVVSDTELRLFKPFDGTTNAAMFATTFPVVKGVFETALTEYGVTSSEGVYLAVVGTGQRLVIAVRQRAFISDRNDPFTFASDSYLEIPSDSVILGADAIQDTTVLFTTAGVWTLSNLDFDAVDAAGNVQWQQAQISKDVILWGDSGIAAWHGAFVVPALDDVVIFSLDGTSIPVSGSIRPIYRSYVKAGYRPGLARVHRGHYLLPILNGTSLVDVLVCRLDRNAAWTTWAGGAASAAYAQRVGTDGSPELLGITAARVTDLTGCFDPTDSNTTDADGTAPDFELVTRDMPTGANQPGFAAKVRARYELDSDTATIAVAFSSDQDDGVFTDLTERGEQDGGSGWAASDGSKYQWAIVGKRRERIRFRFRLTGASSRFVLRSIELLTRPSGKQ